MVFLVFFFSRKLKTTQGVFGFGPQTQKNNEENQANPKKHEESLGFGSFLFGFLEFVFCVFRVFVFTILQKTKKPTTFLVFWAPALGKPKKTFCFFLSPPTWKTKKALKNQKNKESQKNFKKKTKHKNLSPTQDSPQNFVCFWLFGFLEVLFSSFFDLSKI